MSFKYPQWPKRIVKALLDNPEIVKICAIPAAFFFLDVILRAALHIDLIDAGADMALLAVATFFSLLVEDDKGQQSHTPAIGLLIVVFFGVWIGCLAIVSMDPLLVLSLDFRLILSWFIGIAAFFFSGALVNFIILNSHESASE